MYDHFLVYPNHFPVFFRVKMVCGSNLEQFPRKSIGSWNLSATHLIVDKAAINQRFSPPDGVYFWCWAFLPENLQRNFTLHQCLFICRGEEYNQKYSSGKRTRTGSEGRKILTYEKEHEIRWWGMGTIQIIHPRPASPENHGHFSGSAQRFLLSFVCIVLIYSETWSPLGGWTRWSRFPVCRRAL